MKRFAKRLLAIGWIRKSYEAINRVTLETLGWTPSLVHVFYFFSFLTFGREQTAVFRGRRNYYRNKQRGRVTHVELRRNVHRLEKGILMRPRRESFALDYIEETTEFFEVAVAQVRRDPEHTDSDEVYWARDVLREYFAAVGEQSPVIQRCRARFDALAFDSEAGARHPYPHAQLPELTVGYDDMLTLAQRRRSVRWFDGRPVEREVLDKALLVARQAPTACNRLPYEYRIFDDAEMVAKVAGLPFGAAGYAHNIPTIAVVVGKLDSYFSPRDRHAVYVDASLSAMSFLLALETLGVSTSVINWPDFEPLENKMQKLLGLDTTERVVMLIAIGYADSTGMVAYSQKKQLSTLRSFNALA
ncbi:nitroreductase family protein [Salinibacterium sp. ZJ450]|uniref:nitroreductase family protein n=1 Tax=Salinibacterium sp. ZJ450 TaxID=2708338 RepID=UPI001CD1A195|nr:nitroreductase family protein [Salinibacterium sp. ZJ450]